jgi:hypothetical protein
MMVRVWCGFIVVVGEVGGGFERLALRPGRDFTEDVVALCLWCV